MEGISASLRLLFAYNPLVARSRKLDLEKIRAALNTTCSHCKTSIPPDKQVRVDFEHVKCQGCGKTFMPAEKLLFPGFELQSRGELLKGGESQDQMLAAAR